MSSKKTFLFVMIFGLVLPARSDSLLTAKSFPRGYDDLPFMERLLVLEEGYNDFEMEFDANGYCVSGCPYPGIKFEEVERDFNEADELFSDDMEQADIDNLSEDDLYSSEIGIVQNDEIPVGLPLSGKNTPVGLPLSGKNTITSCFKKRSGKHHTGLDIKGTMGANVFATGNGTVEKIYSSCRNGENTQCGANGYRRYGNIVLIKHNDNYKTLYAHLNSVLVKQWDHVQKGGVIGTVGNTGYSSGPHLHYEVRRRISSGMYVQINPYRIAQGYVMADKDGQCR